MDRRPPRRGSLFAAAVVAGSALAGPRAAADRAQTDAARIDWAVGLVTAGGTGVADRHAPSPAVALGTSRRGADQAAKQRIADKLAALPLASGGTLASKRADPALQARLAAAVDAAITVAAEPETDGSWHVTLGVPLEAVRQAVAGPRALPVAGDAGPAIVVVEGVTAKPAIGWTIGGTAAATLWGKDVPAWAKDAPRIRAGAAKAGDLTVDANPGTGATLYVLVSKP